MSSKEHCHGCGKLWSDESPNCVFNYHKKLEKELVQANYDYDTCKRTLDISDKLFDDKVKQLEQATKVIDEITNQINKMKEIGFDFDPVIDSLVQNYILQKNRVIKS